jgi:hypothetical protein
MPVPPISFPPFGNPPFLIPPPIRIHQRGGNRRGHWHGGRNGAALIRWVPNPSGAARRRPSGSRIHSAACPPCSLAPEGPGALVGQGRARSSHLPNPSWSSQAHPLTRAAVALTPVAPFRPQGGGRVGFAAAPGLARKSACKTRQGRSPEPPWRRACCPAAGRNLASVIIHSNRRILANRHSPLCHRPTEAIMPSTSLPQDQPHHRHE